MDSHGDGISDEDLENGTGAKVSKENRKYERIFRLVQQYSELTELSLSQYKILKDLSQSHDSWIRCNVAKELINFGSNEAKTIFGPTKNLARAQFALILYRIEESPEVSFSGTFHDIKLGPADEITREHREFFGQCKGEQLREGGHGMGRGKRYYHRKI